MERSTLDLISSLTAALETAATTIPEADSDATLNNGISLLDVKKELLLSYLQNLVFLILLKIRNAPAALQDDRSQADSSFDSSNDAVVKRLVQLRVYLEKGVRPLEARLKYQIDKVIRAADDADRSAKMKANANGKSASKEVDDAGSETSENSSDDDASNQSSRTSAEEIDDLAYRPNPSALVRPGSKKNATENVATTGVYKPPRIMPTALPTTTTREKRSAQKTMRSATLDEFVEAELGTAPMAEPSVGTTIAAGGRRNKSAAERAVEAERREYEEANFMRLPKESKKERAKSGAGRAGRDGGYGGEEWRMLGAGADRIERLTRKKEGSGGVLERSRKRAVEDGTRGSGEVMGERFEKRRKLLMKRRKR